MSSGDTTGEARLAELVDELLIKDKAKHKATLTAIAKDGDERIVPHLVEVLFVDTIANNWEKFGFPEIMRREPPPDPLSHPEVRWPGIIDALCAIAEPNFDNPETAWLKWESWHTRTDIDALDGYRDWKVRFYRAYYPPVGHMLDVSPTVEDFDLVRWGGCDQSILHPLNGPEFTPANEAEYIQNDDCVFGFHIDDQAYAVPRFIHFPHEMLNAELSGKPITLSLCTMCNSPILYDRRVNGRALQFGNSGFIWQGNKVMYDEETYSLWNQQTGTPIAGELYAEDDRSLTFLPITQTRWEDWKDDNPDTEILARETGYDYEYEYYRNYDGFIKRHYWENEEAIHPGVPGSDEGLSGKTYVYGIETEGGENVRVYPEDSVQQNEPIEDVLQGNDVVVVFESGDIAVYEAPTLPVERRGEKLVDGQNREWEISHDGLHSRGDTLDRIAGRHGLWLSFRPHYSDYSVVTGDD